MLNPEQIVGLVSGNENNTFSDFYANLGYTCQRFFLLYHPMVAPNGKIANTPFFV